MRLWDDRMASGLYKVEDKHLPLLPLLQDADWMVFCRADGRRRDAADRSTKQANAYATPFANALY